MSNMRQGKANPTEHEEQCKVVQWFRLKYPKSIIYAIPNGGLRNIFVAKKLKLEGLVPGIPDLFVCEGHGDYFGLFVEMKTEKGRVSTVQAAIINKLNDVGYLAVVAKGYNHARELITNYMELK